MSIVTATSFLNVYSEKQGSKNLAALLSSVPFLLLVALYFLCYGLLNLDAQGVDVRDMFDDFRLTLPACSALHWWGNATAALAPAPELAASASAAAALIRSQVISDGLGDPRSFFISGRRLAMYLPNTQNAYTSFAGPVVASGSSGAATWTAAAGWTVPSLPLSLFISISSTNASSDDAPRSQRFSRVVSRQTSSGMQSYAVADISVPLVSMQADAAGAQLRAHALSDVWVDVSFASASSQPRLVRVSSKYQLQPLQSFPAAAPALAASFPLNGAPTPPSTSHPLLAPALTRTPFAGLDSISFTAHVTDINQPRPFVPNFAFSFQANCPPPSPPLPLRILTLVQWVVAGAVLALVALLLFIIWLYLRCWVVVNNVRANTGSLPICFASMPEYRGW